MKSLTLMSDMIYAMPEPETDELGNPQPDSMVVSLVEGWRGEICHCAITDEKGE
jgi:Ni,Fe-hydrogenase III large subunit